MFWFMQLTMHDQRAKIHPIEVCHYYPSELFDIFGRHLPGVHCYSDDSQLYVAISPNVVGDDEIALSAMHDCIKDLKNDQESIEVE